MLIRKFLNIYKIKLFSKGKISMLKNIYIWDVKRRILRDNERRKNKEGPEDIVRIFCCVRRLRNLPQISFLSLIE